MRLVARRQRVGLGTRCALTQRSTQGWLPSIRRKPQWTTSWSSTISTRSFVSSPTSSRRDRARRPSLALVPMRHDEADLPQVAVAGAELEQPTVLKRLEAGQTQAHAGDARVSLNAVVCHLEHECPVAEHRVHGDARGVGMLVRIADRLGEDGLSERLELGGDRESAGSAPSTAIPRSGCS